MIENPSNLAEHVSNLTERVATDIKQLRTDVSKTVLTVNNVPPVDGNVDVDIPPSVHVGTEAPADTDTVVWVDPESELSQVVTSVNGTLPDEDGNVQLEIDVSGKIDKAGDTVTGQLVFTTSDVIRREDKYSWVEICGGTDGSDGARLVLTGEGDGDQGAWKLDARDTSGDGHWSRLLGTADGKLTFQDKNIVRSVNGSVADQDGNIQLPDNTFTGGTITSDILPNANATLNLGSETKKFKSIYADEVHISQNTLYIGDTPVLGTDQNTINIKADADQSIMVKTSGIGSTQLYSENAVLLKTDGSSANINLNAAGANSEVSLNAKTRVSVNAPDIVLDGTTTITNLHVTGTTTVVNSTNLQVKDNLIEINSGETGNGVSMGTAGIKVNRGDALPYMIVFDESDDMFKIGEQGDLETIASHDYVDAKIEQNKYTHPATHSASMITGLADVATSGKYSDLSGVPTSLPADGGNADTVSGFTVGTNVPVDAKFTDTTYSTGTSTTSGLTKLYAGTGTNTDGTLTQSAITTALNGKLDASANAVSASKLATARTITLGGDASGSVSFDGSENKTLTVTIADDSHNHIISNVDGLQDALDAKLDATAKAASAAVADSANAVVWTNVSGKPTSFTPSSHDQASNTITAMTGYSKPSTTSAIAATDSLNAAVGKLEKALDGKLASTANAVSASKWANARTITLGGDASGSVSIDGSTNATLTVTVTDDSHNHVISNVDGLQSALDGKASTGSVTTALADAKSYTDTKIAALIDTAPETLDTLGEVAEALAANEDVVDALNAAVGTKANDADVVKLSGNQTIAGTKTFSGTIVGSISGNAATATKATQDGSGNVITATYATKAAASTTTAGLMSADDKKKLDGIATGANAYVHPSYTAKTSGFYKVAVDATGHVSAATAVTKADITGLGIPAQDTVYTLPAATSSALGGVKVGNNITVSSGTISLTKANVTTALGYTPPTQDTVYTHPATHAANMITGLATVATSGKYSDLSGTPTSLPANGGNAATVGGFTVGTNVPADAKFTDTVYTLPTAAKDVLGGVKTTSTVTSTSGLTACPIIGGVPYYKDTNNTYTLSSFGVTATAAELNYVDGVTSNIQTQLNGKLSTSGTAAKATADASGNTITSTYATKTELTNGLAGKLNTTGGNVSGHIYLTGAQQNSSTGNTSQIVFGTTADNHVCISSNQDAIVINESLASTASQIVLYLKKASVFPSGIQANVTGNLTGTASKATADGNGNNIINTYAAKQDILSAVNSLSQSNVSISATDLTNIQTSLASVESEVSTKLPLNGGTMTGPIVCNGAIANCSVDTSNVQLNGGTGWNKGASIDLYGMSRTNDSGAFKFRAHNGTNYNDFIGKPDGTLTWGSKDIVRSVNGTEADANGNVTLSKADIVESLGFTPLQSAPVSSVNGKTGAVTLACSDIGALPTTGGTISGSLAVTGDITGATVLATSDKRLKSNVEKYNADISALGTYRYVLNSDQKQHVGLIAQEVQQCIPEAVVQNDAGFYSVDYNAVVAVLVGKINELEARLAKLEQ